MKKRKVKADNCIEKAEEVKPLPDVAVKLNCVSFSYSEEQPYAVKDVTLEVKRGEFIAVLGHNGSGKSTLARLICGLLTADKGSVEVWGYNPAVRSQLGAVREHAGVVFQNPDNQMVASIVEDDVAFGPENLGVPREEIGRRIDWALSAVGMEKYRHSTPTRLSGGQKQRIAVAGVLAIKPDVLILDESTAMLDPRGRREVTEVAARLNREEGMTVILITHFMDEALLADRAVVMNRGEIALQGAPKEIFGRGEELESYNLCLPEIGVICNRLRAAGIPVEEALEPAELARQIEAQAQTRGFKTPSSGYMSAPIEQNGAKEWDIDVQNLTYTYSAKSPFASKALNGVNLHISQGEFFGIIGHTGSGKSTLIKLICRLYEPSEGRILLDGVDIREISREAYMDFLSVVFQDYQIFAATLGENIAMKSDADKGRVEEAIGKIGLKLTEQDMPLRRDLEADGVEVSGGEGQKIAIARALYKDAPMVILDEPTAALDPFSESEIYEKFGTLVEGKLAMFISHRLSSCRFCDRILVLQDGKIVQDGSHEVLAGQEGGLYREMWEAQRQYYV